MKVGVVSDLHPLHHKNFTPIFDSIVASVERERPNYLVDAGDWENETLCDVLAASLPEGTRYVKCHGNHDYYSNRLPGPTDDVRLVVDPDGLSFAVAPLWTDLNGGDAETVNAVWRYLNDFRWIPGMTTQHMMDLHRAHVQFLSQCRVDVVITHHLPSKRSVHPRWEAAGKASYGFYSDRDDLIELISPKLWVHGHTHDPCDYMHGETRVVCNPLGYPGERSMLIPYEPVYVEV